MSALSIVYQPQNLQLAVTAGQIKVALTWNAVGGSLIVGYNVRRDGVLIATAVATNAYTDSTVSLGHHYNYEVTAVDGSGNESPATPIQRAEVLQGSELDWTVSWVEQPGMAGRPDLAWNWR